VIERVFADGKLLVDNLHGGCSEVDFNPGARNLVFHFGILAPAEQASFFYRHRLNGMQTGWSPVQRERSASFEWLPPGKYSFEVVTGNGDLWSEESAELNFEVRAFFWQTTWFYVCLAAVLAAFIFLIARSIVNQRYKMQMEMMRREEALHHERARISRDIHDDLGNGLSVVATLSELTHSDVEKESAHRRLDQIYDVANELARNVDEIVWAVNPVNDSWEPFISYFEQYTEYFLGNTALRFHFARPPELSDVKVASKTRHHLLLSVREAIGNILKHADAGQVNITMSIEKDELIIRVEDDGKGFDATVSAGVGHNGLVNMSRRMKEINGNMVIDSVPGRGTTITFSVRLERLNGFGGDIDA
jgi:signal transduction histidine kinase